MARQIAKVFATGRSQAVRIPKSFRFATDEVYIERDGERVILTPRRRAWSRYFAEAKRFSDDFPEKIEDAPAEERERF